MKPEEEEPADDGIDAVLINGRVEGTDGITVCSVLISTNDSALVHKRDPGIRDDRRKQKGMSLAAFRAPESADPEGLDTAREKDTSFIVGMNGQTGGMPAGAAQLLELEGIYD